jgi:hypothetical protein
MSNLCPCCGQRVPDASEPGAEKITPEFLRLVDPKGRVSLPAAVIATHGRYYSARGDQQRIHLRPDLYGRRAVLVDPSREHFRYTLPVEWRERTGIRPGMQVAVARVGREVLVWRL